MERYALTKDADPYDGKPKIGSSNCQHFSTI